MVAGMVGIDPHKRSNTAVVLDRNEKVLARQRGLSLAQRLAMEHERVLDVPAFLSARVRALGGGSGRKIGESDAYALAVAGLRGHDLQIVLPEDQVAVRKMLSDRRQQLVEQRIAAVNRLHDVQHAQDVAELGGNRRLNYALHVAVLVQIRFPGPGQDYYLRRRAEGKKPLEAMRCLKRRLSDVVLYAESDRAGEHQHLHPCR